MKFKMRLMWTIFLSGFLLLNCSTLLFARVIPEREIRLTGSIGKNGQIHMQLQIAGAKVRGSYYYDRFKKPLSLKGSLVNQKLILAENDPSEKKTGYFEGLWITDYPKDHYGSFQNCLDLVIPVDDLDGYHAKVYNIAVKHLFTIMEGIIMVGPNNRIWAAVIEDNQVYYFTNTPLKTKLPRTIENWRKRFVEKQVVFCR